MQLAMRGGHLLSSTYISLNVLMLCDLSNLLNI